jgi:hypothetical protein
VKHLVCHDIPLTCNFVDKLLDPYLSGSDFPVAHQA